MPRNSFFGSAGAVCFPATIIIALFAALPNCAQTLTIKKRQVIIPGQRAVVADERLAALRAQPDIKAPLVQRLRYGRVVGIIGPARAGREGMRFFPVAVSRNTQGWVLADAVIRPRHAADAARLVKVMNETSDIFTRARLARLCADEFRGMSVAPRALLILGTAAEQAAARLSRNARRTINDASDEDGEGLPGQREYALNYVGLDRYNRIGVTFDYDQSAKRLIYDGSAYREILRKYPRSAEAKEARERWETLKKSLVSKR